MKRLTRWVGILLGTALLTQLAVDFGWTAGGSAKPKKTSPVQVSVAEALATGSASITGKVTLEGAAPAREKVKMAADPVCLAQHQEPVLSQEILSSNGSLQNVVVYVKSGLSGSHPAPTTPVILDQQGCMYHPHVFGIQAGQPLEIRNSDATLHNINAQPKTNKKFNIAQPVKGMKTLKTFDQPEVVPFKCNVHPWMSAYGVVVSNPFYQVTDSSGLFSLNGLPAGTYTLEAWHEKLGTQTQSVTVADGETQSAHFSFKAK